MFPFNFFLDLYYLSGMDLLARYFGMSIKERFEAELFRLQAKYGHEIYHVSQRPKGGLYIGKGSPYANPWRGSTKPIQRLRNIYRYANYVKTNTSSTYSESSLTEIRDRIYVCYCNYGKNDHDENTLCHGMVLKAIAHHDFKWSTLEDTHND